MSINSQLARLFIDHGLDASLDGDWIVFPRSTVKLDDGFEFEARVPRIKGEIHRGDNPQSKAVRLDILVDLVDGRVLFECFAGWGDDESSAIADGISNFVVSSLHVLLTSIYGRADEQTINEIWEIDGVSWKATLGDFVFRGTDFVSVDPPNDLFPKIESLIRNQRLDRDIHWFRFFHGRNQGISLASEALYDNEEWPEAAAILENQSWPEVNGYYSARRFLVLSKSTMGELKGSGEVTRNLIRAVEAFRDNPTADETELTEILISKGIAADVADQLVDFIPIAFTRMAMPQFESVFSDRFQWVDDRGTVVDEKHFVEFPLFLETLRFAGEDAGLLVDSDEFIMIASYGAEFKIIQQALEKGVNVETLKISPLMKLNDSVRPRLVEETKQWWQFWK